MKLTLPQQDIYFEQLLFPNSSIYNIGAKIVIEGEIDISIFKTAYTNLINQHDAYRSVINIQNDDIEVQFAQPYNPILEYKDFSARKNPETDSNLFIEIEFKKPFNLTDKSPLYKFALLKVRDDLFFLFSVYHHIITDGWGTALMFQRLVNNYNEILTAGEILSIYPFSYKDFVDDDQNYNSSDEFKVNKKYWKQKFSKVPDNLFDKIDTSFTTSESSRKVVVIKRDIYNRLITLSGTIKSNPFHFILAALFAYFGRKHQNFDFSIGLPVLNRPSLKFKKTVGLFMGVNPLRLSFNIENTILELVSEIKNQLRQDYRHQRFPLSNLINELKLYSQKDRLFNITLSYEKQDYSSHFHGTKTTVIPLTNHCERVALALYIREFDSDEDVVIDFDYNLNYFTAESISTLTDHFEIILSDILKEPSKKIYELEYMSSREKQQILVDFNNPMQDYPKDKTIIDLFEDAVVCFADNCAIRYDKLSYTYSQVNEKVNLISNYFIENYGNSNEPIAVILNRTSDLIFVLLGILKSGKCYIPIDPNLPVGRIEYIIANSKSRIIINESNDCIRDRIEYISLERILNSKHNTKGNSNKPKNSDTAYVIYTSGTTGDPKGVEVKHQSLTNLLTSIQLKPGINSNDLFYSITTYSFDISILEFFGPLTCGACVYLPDYNILNDPKKIISELYQLKPTIIQATPSFYQMLFHFGWQGNENLKILCGGDLLSRALANKLINSSGELWNMYGPTETTIWSSVKKIERFEDADSIGKAINNTKFFIVDRNMDILPLGMMGNIFIGGDGLAASYYNNPSLTSEKFIDSPFHHGEKIYDTGDIGKWNKDGEIIFLGRSDNQVKIRGYRIELNEIEAHLNKYLNNNNSVVLSKKLESEELILVAYISKLSGKLSKEEIKYELQKFLPQYMIPSVFVELNDLPKTPNQKIDRNALSNIPISFDAITSRKAITITEIALENLWRRVLSTKYEIGVDDNFFLLGGHSITAMKLISGIEEVFALRVSMKDIFENPSIELLSKFIENQAGKNEMVLEKTIEKDFYDLTPSQLNIWYASQSDPDISRAYNMFSAFSVKGKIDIPKLEKIFTALIKKYEILRTNYVNIEGVPYQKITLKDNVEFKIENLFVNSDNNINDILTEFSNHEFNLQDDLLLKIAIAQVDNYEILLFLTHHIILDGFSIGLLIKESLQGYEGNFIDLKISHQFRDYSEWLQNDLIGTKIKNENFWGNYLNNFSKQELIPKITVPSQKLIGKGSKMLFVVSKVTLVALKDMASENNTTLYNILLAIFKLLLNRISYEDDICIGTVINGRNIHRSSDMLGMFAKTLPIRTKINEGNTFIEFLKIIQNQLFDIESYQDLPLNLKVSRLFDVLFVYQNYDISFYNGFNYGGANLKLIHHENIIPRVPLVFNLFECAEDLVCEIDFDVFLYDPVTLTTLWNEYEAMIRKVIVNANLSLNEYCLDLKDSTINEYNFDINFNF